MKWPAASRVPQLTNDLQVTALTVSENWAQLPFDEHWKLYLSDIPYDVDFTGSDRVTESLRRTWHEQKPAVNGSVLD